MYFTSMIKFFFLIFSVRRKDLNHQKLSLEHRKKIGIPQHFGMYYAMGIALIMEGLFTFLVISCLLTFV